jgi:hypothetical protein
MPDDGVGCSEMVAGQKESIPIRIETIVQKAIYGASPSRTIRLERFHIFGLPTLGTLGNVELNRLALLETLETARLDCREVHKNIFATPAADEPVTLGIVEPLYRPLFRHIDTGVPFSGLTLERLGGTDGRYWLVRRVLLSTDSV